ncbi:MAG: hypothetical protein FGM52_14555, partial [Mycobacterium sp.]|nr:hypothetical protein [Mycobacterium sp.]
MSKRWGLALGLGLGAAVLCGHGVASAAPEAEPGLGPRQSEAATSERARPNTQPRRVQPAARTQQTAPAPSAPQVGTRSAASATPGARARRSTIPEVSVELPPMPVTEDRAFTVSQPAITEAATAYVAAGGDPSDAPRFFFGDLATGSLDTLA